MSIESKAISEVFTTALNNAIPQVLCSSLLDYDASFHKKAEHSVDYDSKIIAYISSKALEAKLMVNVSSVEIIFRPDFISSKVETTVTYDLKSNGHVWSNIFSSFISKKIIHELRASNGSITGQYQCNATLEVETFSLKITHDLLTGRTSFMNVGEKIALSRVDVLDM